MTSPSAVRIAKPDDSQEIWRLFLQGHKENGIFRLAPEKVDYFMWRCLHGGQLPPTDTGSRGVIGVIGEPGALEALALLVIGEYWYTTEKHLEEMLVYVDPEHRKSHHARVLVSWMKRQSELTGLPLLTGVISNDRTEAKCALYRRMLTDVERRCGKVGEFFLYLGNKGSSPSLAVAASS